MRDFRHGNLLQIAFENLFEGPIVMQHLEDVCRRNNLTCDNTTPKVFDDIYRTIIIHCIPDYIEVNGFFARLIYYFHPFSYIKLFKSF